MKTQKSKFTSKTNTIYLLFAALFGVLVTLIGTNLKNRYSSKVDHFFSIDKTLSRSEYLTKDISSDIKRSLHKEFEGPKEPLKPIFFGAMDYIKSEVDAFNDYVESIKIKLIDQTGNQNSELDWGDMNKYGKPSGQRNKAIVRKQLITESLGDTLYNKMVSLRKRILDSYAQAVSDSNTIEITKLNTVDKSEVAKKIEALDHAIELKPWSIEQIKARTRHDNWTSFRFNELSLAATIPLLTKFQVDARNAQALIAQELSHLVGGRGHWTWHPFWPIMNARSGYVVKGEKFESEIAILAFSDELAENTSVIVNGDTIKLNKEGRGVYTETAHSYGRRTLNMRALIRNPITGEVYGGRGSFDYEVGARAASLSIKKMNTFYIGVDNPFEVSIAGYSSKDIRVKCIGEACKVKGSNGQYIANVSKPGVVQLKVSAPNFSRSFKIKAQPIPDPSTVLGSLPIEKQEVKAQDFRNQEKLLTYIKDFNFSISCKIQEFQLIKISSDQLPVSVHNHGDIINPETKDLVEQAQAGDIYCFKKIRTLCRNDVEERQLNPLIYFIQ